MKAKYAGTLLLTLFLATYVEAQTRGSWQTLAPMPSMRQEVSTAVLGNKVYVIAGFFSNGASSNLVEAYDVSTNTWSSAANLPIENNHNAAATVGNRIFAFGGTSNRSFSYNPDMNQWTEVASMNFQHGNTAAVAVIDGKILRCRRRWSRNESARGRSLQSGNKPMDNPGAYERRPQSYRRSRDQRKVLRCGWTAWCSSLNRARGL